MVTPIVRRKTLQLNFKRGGDAFYKRSEDIQFMGPAQWMYRGSKLDVPALPKLDGGESADKKKEPAEKPKENDKPKDNGKEKEKPKDKD